MLFRRLFGRAAVPRARDSEPPSAVDRYCLQYSRPGSEGECELVVGLDFGTSSSKVVIQAPDLPGHPSYAVDFGSLSCQSMPHLVPTRVWVSPQGECSLVPHDLTSPVKDIKLELLLPIESSNSSSGPTRQGLDPQSVAACYLALVLRASRQWFLETKAELLRQFSSFSWSMNLGVPSPCIEDNEQNGAFRRVGKAGWMLSTLMPPMITTDQAKVELVRVDDDDYFGADNSFACDFDIIPEIAAAAVGYAMSDLRRQGLHVIIDVGASTVDACSFLLGEEAGSDSYSLLIADVQRYGTSALHNYQLSALEAACQHYVDQVRGQHDPLQPLPDDQALPIVPPHTMEEAVDRAAAGFRRAFLLMLRRVIWETRKRRNPRDPIWKTGRLPILLIGGGTKAPFFMSAVQELDGWLKDHARNRGVTFLVPPLPSTLTRSSTTSEDYLFLAVAWGLSHRAPDFGKIIPADQIADAEPLPKLDLTSRYVSKDIV